MIAAVILAAGASRRMGRNKMLLEVEGESLLRRTARRALTAGCRPVVVVVGHEAPLARATLAGLDVDFAVSPDPTGPNSGSLHAGLAALGPGVDAAIVLLADMPHVTADMIRALLRSHEAGGALEVSRYGDVFAPPLLFPRALWPELQASHGEGCGKAVVKAHQAQATLHDWPPERLQDIDTPADFAQLRV